MNEYFSKERSLRGNLKVELYLPNYATKAEIAQKQLSYIESC